MSCSAQTNPSLQGCSNIFERLQLHAGAMVYRYLHDPELTLVYCNNACQVLAGFAAESLIGQSYRRLRFDSATAQNCELAVCELKPAQEYKQQYLLRTKDGSAVEVVDYAYGIFDAAHTLVAVEGVIVARGDCSACGTALPCETISANNAQIACPDAAIHEHRLATLIAAIDLPCVLNTPDQRITHLNSAFTEAFGYLADDIPNLPLWWVQAYPDLSYREWVTKEWRLHIEQAKNTGAAFEPLMVRIRCKSGQVKSVSASATPLDVDWAGTLLVTLTDLSEHETLQHEKLERELRYRTLFDSANISLWNEDLSDLLRRLDELRNAGVTDLAAYLDSEPSRIFEFIELFKVIDVNRATERLFGAKKKELLAGFSRLFGPGALDVLRAELLSFWERKPHFSSEVNLLTLDKRPIRAIVSFQIPRTIEAAATVPVSIQDLSVTQALQNELALRGEILENIHQGVYLIRASDGVIVYINPTLEAIFASDEQYFLGRHFSVLCGAGAACEASTGEMLASLNASGHWNGELYASDATT